jgi:hypothetical protein
MKTSIFTHAVGCSYGECDILGKDGSLNSSYVTIYGTSREDAINRYNAHTSGHESQYISSIELIEPFEGSAYEIEDNLADTNSTWFVSNGCTFWYDPTGEFDINSDSCEHIAVKNYISNAQGIASSLEKAIEQAKNIGIQFFTEEKCQQ